MSLCVDVLGPLRLRVDGSDVAVPGLRRRALLAFLAVAEGRAVTVDTLVNALWPDEPPASASAALHSHVSRLRRHLGPYADCLRRDGPAYRLDRTGLDAAEARRLADEATAAQGSDPARAVELSQQALALWRGRALEEFIEILPLAARAVALDELHQRLVDGEIAARLQQADAHSVDQVLQDAAAVARADPLRERPTLHWIRALAMAGRANEAMDVAAGYRRALAEATGLDPGPALAALEHDVAAGVLAPAAADRAPRVARSSAPLVGRDRELGDLLALLRAPGTGVVTLTGPGGVGKTRLATEVAAELSADGPVVMVRLAAVREPGRVVPAVAAALGVRLGREGPAALADALAGRALTVVLDNCEHVVDACRDLVTSVHQRAGGVRVLATSRVPLRVDGEYVVRLPPLPLRDAVAAFVEHAGRRHRGFALAAGDTAAVEEIVTRLDGLPLAIELVAGHVGTVPLTQLRARLGRALDMFEADRPRGDERHRSLRSTIDWSYRLLGADEQVVLLSLAPFVGGVDLSTVDRLAEELAPGRDPVVLLTRLVEASLVVPQPDDAARYTVLETVRAYLLDELHANGHEAAAQRRLVGWAVRTTAEIGPALQGPDEAAADRRLRAELANLDAAASLALGGHDLAPVVAMVVALENGLVWRDLSPIGHWPLELADADGLDAHPAAAAVLARAAEVAWLRGDLDRCEALADRGLALQPDDPWCWSVRGVASLFRARFPQARRQLLRAGMGLERPATSLATAALAAAYAGDADAGELLRTARAALDRRPGPGHTAYVEYVEGELAALAGDHDTAAEALTSAIARARDCGATFVEGVAMVALTSVWARSGRVAPAAEGYRQLLGYWARAGNWTQLWTTARNAAGLLADHGRPELAVALLHAADRAPAAAAMGAPARARLEATRARAAAAAGPAATDASTRRAERLGPAELVAAAREALAALS